MFWFWCFMLVCDLLIPLVMIVFGTRFLKKPPKKINCTYGYRTARSMKSRDTWAFAHQYFGKLWRAVGWVLLPLSVIAMLPAWGKDVSFVGIYGTVVCFIQLILLLIPLPFVERALKQNFDQNGKRIPSQTHL